MNIDLLPLISFVLITTFTPGPNNMSSAAMGVKHGYPKILHYLLGISAGFFLIMMICAYLATALLTVVPAAERYLRWPCCWFIRRSSSRVSLIGSERWCCGGWAG